MKHCGIIHDIQIEDDFSSEESDIRLRSVHACGYPKEDTNALWHYPFYQYCQQHGIADLFSGFGGDEVITFPGVIHVRAELFEQRNWTALWRILPGAWSGKFKRLAYIQWHQRRQPSRNAIFLEAWKQRWPYQFVNPVLLRKYDLENAYYATATYDQCFRRVNDVGLHLLARSYASARLESSTLLATGCGVDYAWPMWDQRLIQQWLSTPAIWKVGDGDINRYLHRAAVAGVGPDKVVWNPDSKDMGYASIHEKASQASNAAILKRILELAESMQGEMQAVLDMSKVRHMVEQGIKQDWRGEEV